MLMIEVPDPDAFMGRLLGRLWLPWFQPQHQHFLSVGRLEALLRKHEFEPVLWHRREAHQRVDLFFATALLTHLVAPPINLPWREPDGFGARLRNRVVWSLALPAILVARLADLFFFLFARWPGWWNTYRVVARRK